MGRPTNAPQIEPVLDQMQEHIINKSIQLPITAVDTALSGAIC